MRVTFVVAYLLMDPDSVVDSFYTRSPQTSPAHQAANVAQEKEKEEEDAVCCDAHFP